MLHQVFTADIYLLKLLFSLLLHYEVYKFNCPGYYVFFLSCKLLCGSQVRDTSPRQAYCAGVWLGAIHLHFFDAVNPYLHQLKKGQQGCL